MKFQIKSWNKNLFISYHKGNFQKFPFKVSNAWIKGECVNFRSSGSVKFFFFGKLFNIIWNTEKLFNYNWFLPYSWKFDVFFVSSWDLLAVFENWRKKNISANKLCRTFCHIAPLSINPDFNNLLTTNRVAFHSREHKYRYLSCIL